MEGDNEFKRQTNSFAWLYYSIAACFFFGNVNFVLGRLAARLQLAGSYPIGFGMVFMFLVYHLVVRPTAR